MTETNYEKIADVINDHVHSRARKVNADEIRHLVGLHGWLVVGAMIEHAKGDQQLRDLTEAGVPFNAAAKMLGWSDASGMVA